MDRQRRPDSMAGGAVTSEQKSLSGITRSRIAAGKIVESWTEWDRIGVLRKLEFQLSGPDAGFTP